MSESCLDSIWLVEHTGAKPLQGTGFPCQGLSLSLSKNSLLLSSICVCVCFCILALLKTLDELKNVNASGQVKKNYKFLAPLAKFLDLVGKARLEVLPLARRWVLPVYHCGNGSFTLEEVYLVWQRMQIGLRSSLEALSFFLVSFSLQSLFSIRKVSNELNGRQTIA